MNNIFNNAELFDIYLIRTSHSTTPIAYLYSNLDKNITTLVNMFGKLITCKNENGEVISGQGGYVIPIVKQTITEEELDKLADDELKKANELLNEGLSDDEFHAYWETDSWKNGFKFCYKQMQN